MSVMALALSAHAGSKPFADIFFGKNTEFSRGTAQALEIARATGRPVLVAFPNIKNANGEVAVAAVSDDDSFKWVNFGAFEFMSGFEMAPVYNDEAKSNPVFAFRGALNVLNGNAEVYVAGNAGAEAKDRLRYGGRFVVHSWTGGYDAPHGDLYVYGETSPGNPNTDNLVTNTATNIDLRKTAGVGLRLTNKKGLGAQFELGLAYFTKPIGETKQRGWSMGLGFVKKYGYVPVKK